VNLELPCAGWARSGRIPASAAHMPGRPPIFFNFSASITSHRVNFLLLSERLVPELLQDQLQCRGGVAAALLLLDPGQRADADA